MALCILCSTVIGEDLSCACFHACLHPALVPRPKALMLTGSIALESRSYFNHTSDTFKAGSTAWFASPVAALSRTEQDVDSGKSPSVLILDDFDAEGSDNGNITNMQKLCHDLARLRDLPGERYDIFIVVITQSRDVANKSYRINNW